MINADWVTGVSYMNRCHLPGRTIISVRNVFTFY